MTTARSAFAVVVLAVAAPVAWAENPYLQAALRLYADFEYESALDKLKKAATWPANVVADDVAIASYKGLVLAELGDAAGAETAFKEALALDPSVQLPTRVSPKVGALFDKARSELSSARPVAAPTVSVRPAPESPRPPGEPPRSAVLAPTPSAAGPTQVGAGGAPPAIPAARQPRLPDPASTTAAVPSAPPPRVAPPARELVNAALAAPEPDRRSREIAPYAAAAATPRAEPPRRSVPLPLALLVGGVACAAVGGYFGIQVNPAADRARAEPFQNLAAEHLDAARSASIAANGLFIGAAALAVAGVIAFMSSGRD